MEENSEKKRQRASGAVLGWEPTWPSTGRCLNLPTRHGSVSLSEHSQSQPSLRGKYKYGGNDREQGGSMVDLDEI